MVVGVDHCEAVALGPGVADTCVREPAGGVERPEGGDRVRTVDGVRRRIRVERNRNRAAQLGQPALITKGKRDTSHGVPFPGGGAWPVTRS